MGVLRTLGRVLTGFLVACLVAGLVQVLHVDTPAELAGYPSSELPTRAGSSLELALLAATHSAIFGAAFALIAASISEWLGIRSIGYYLFAGVAIALLGFTAQYSSEVAGQDTILNNYALRAYMTAGFFAGLVYWLVAGKRAGAKDDWPALAAASGADVPHTIVEKNPVAGPANEKKPGSLAEKLARKPAASGTAAGGGTTAVPVTKAADQKPAEATVTVQVQQRPQEKAADKPQEK